MPGSITPILALPAQFKGPVACSMVADGGVFSSKNPIPHDRHKPGLPSKVIMDCAKAAWTTPQTANSKRSLGLAHQSTLAQESPPRCEWTWAHAGAPPSSLLSRFPLLQGGWSRWMLLEERLNESNAAG